MKRQSLIMIGIEESKDSQFERPKNVFNKIIEEIFLKLKKETAINVKEAYGTPNR